MNGGPLSGFDIPPNEGWQLWSDTVTGADLCRGTNTLAVARDTDTRNAFAVGAVRVHWTGAVDDAPPTEPVDG